MPRHQILAVLLLAAFVAAPAAAGADNTHAKGPKPMHISQGREVNLADYVVPGKTTVFDFYSEYCPPCRAIAPHLEKLHLKRDDVAVVKVDINRPGVKGIDWQSPVARQYNLESIPHFKVFGPDGKLKAEGDEARAMVTSWFD
ncbi:MAG TPA: thioredoxin family protein [Opitutaceae bacterium]|nr:thioredoxin family protein [Opitutaceae bacterium]